MKNQAIENDLTVVIFAKGREKQTLRVLNCVLAQSLLPKELVVVENVGSGIAVSKDEIKKMFKDSGVKVECVYVNFDNVAQSRKLGLKKIGTKFGVFFDNDIDFGEDYLSKLMFELKGDDCWGVVGKVLPMTDSWMENGAAENCTQGRNDSKSKKQIVCYGMAAVGLNILKIRKNGLDFDKELDASEDTDFFLTGVEKGARWMFSPKLVIRHCFENHSLLKLGWRNIEYGESYLQVEQKHPWFHFHYYFPETRREWLWLLPGILKKAFVSPDGRKVKYKFLIAWMIVMSNIGVFRSKIGANRLKESFRRCWW